MSEAAGANGRGDDSGLKRSGHRGFSSSDGFLCDHVEILYDVDVSLRRTRKRRNADVAAESLNDSPLLTAALGDCAVRLRGAGETR